MPPPGQPGYSPSRPPNEKDVVTLLNGAPTYLGAIVSTGAALNNANTATPFNFTQTNAPNMAGTLAGKVLLIQASAIGFILASPTAVPALAVATQTTIPPVAGTAPGVQIAANTAQIVVMRQDQGWLQFIPSTGSANLLVWELL